MSLNYCHENRGKLIITYRPFHHRCSYCEVNYDVVGSLEDFNADTEYIIQRGKLTALEGQKTYLGNPTQDPGMSQESRIDSYFSNLPVDTKRRLYELYKIDFEMFGYDGSKYL